MAGYHPLMRAFSDHSGSAWGDLPGPTAATARNERASGVTTVAATVGIVALALGSGIVLALKSRTQLIAPIDPNVETAAVFVGAFAGALLLGVSILRWLDGKARRSGDRTVLGRMADPLAAAFCCVVFATWCARGLVEFYAFAGLAPLPFPADFTVVGRESGRHNSHDLRLRFGPAGRVFSLSVPQATYDAAERGEMVTLPVETGRRGIQRMVAPDRQLAPDDLHHR